MRPSKLTIAGLRSYREAVEIDFSGRELFAIIGDTGAGKSSILEAITYALYNSTTWDQREPKALISDGMHTMTVSLDFESDGRIWRVTRSASRSSSPASVHLLVCVDDTALSFIGEGVVNDQIKKLLGMDYRAFLSAVILPQGRFQTLLTVGAKDRSEILKGIFRLDQLDLAREQIVLLAERAAIAASTLRMKRSMLPEDPAEEAAALKSQLGEQQSARKLITDLQRLIVDLGKDRHALEQEVKKARPAADILRRLERSTAKSLADVIPRAVELDRELKEAGKIHARYEQDEAQLRTEVERAKAAGLDVGELSRIEQALVGAGKELSALALRGGAVNQERTRLDKDRQDLELAKKDLETLTKDGKLAQDTLILAQQASEMARRKSENARAALLGLRDKARRRLELEKQRQSLIASLAKLTTETADKEREAGKAADTVGRAQTQLEEVRRQHSAAHAAQGLKPGEKCPICSVALPKDWTTPSHGPLAPKTEALAAAEKAAQKVREDLGRLRGQHDSGAKNLAETNTHLEIAQAERQLALEAVEAFIAAPDLTRTEAQLLEPLILAFNAGKARADLQTLAVAESQRLVAAAQAKIESANRVLESGHTRVEAEKVAMEEALTKCRTDLETLPHVSLLPGTLTAASLEPLVKRVRGKLKQQRELEQKYTEAAKLLRTQDVLLKNLKLKRGEDVETPARKGRERLLILLPRVNDCLALRKPPQEALAHPQEELELEELQMLAVNIEKCAEETIAALDAHISELDLKVSGIEAQQSVALTKAGFDNADALSAALQKVDGQIGVLTDRINSLEAMIPVLVQLDTLTAKADDLNVSLGELRRLFPAFQRYVSERRQLDLLRIATSIFEGMTAKRYGFSENFEIVDQWTGQPRSPKTLSGGETFLASLSLALGLVEIANRAGGRLGALFLDEGFGSLDGAALDEALNALQKRAGEGKLVAVVSHLQAVAQTLEVALEVVREPSGSKVHWRTGLEANSELESALLA